MEKDIKVLARVFAVTLLLLTVGCTSDKSDAKNISSETSLMKPVNIIVIIDTSDRDFRNEESSSSKEGY